MREIVGIIERRRIILRGNLDRNLVAAFEPATEINQLASFAAEWEDGRRAEISGHLDRLFADGALHGNRMILFAARLFFPGGF
jgi:hypothetical protein